MITSKMSFLGKEVTPVRFIQDEDYRISYVFDDTLSLGDDADNDVDSDAGNGGDGGDTEETVSKAERTAAFLRELLADGPMDSKDVKRAVEASEFSMRTVNRIKDGIVVVERQSDRSSIWMLR